MLFKTLTPHARRAILASTVAFSALVSNPLLPAGLGDGAAFAKSDHSGRQDGVHGHHGKGVDNHGKHKGKHSSNNPNSTDDTDDDDDDSDDDNSPGDDDPADHDANDDHGGDDDGTDDNSSN